MQFYVLLAAFLIVLIVQAVEKRRIEQQMQANVEAFLEETRHMNEVHFKQVQHLLNRIQAPDVAVAQTDADVEGEVIYAGRPDDVWPESGGRNASEEG